MMEEVYAEIRWISHSEGGRKSLPQTGRLYYPHILIDHKEESRSWSICFTVTPINQSGISLISFSMLADNAEANSFFSKLCTGTKFKLLEGNMVVAVGQIKSIV